jgi:hypothetical protein
LNFVSPSRSSTFAQNLNVHIPGGITLTPGSPGIVSQLSNRVVPERLLVIIFSGSSPGFCDNNNAVEVAVSS